MTTRTITIKAVLFDLDGTLVDTESLSDKAMIYAMKEYLGEDWAQQFQNDNYRIPWELKKQLLGLRGSDWGPIVIDYALTHWNLDKDKTPTVQELWSAWEHCLNSLCCQVQACQGATQLVEKLSQLQIPLAIATSSRVASVEEKRKNHESIFSKMKVIVAGDHPAVKNGKPAPDIYVEAARQLGVHPSECLVMEDALSGVQSGKAAGCAVVAIPDSRFTDIEKQVFADIADVVLPNLDHFDGTLFGLDINMPACSCSAYERRV
jgi:pseudouridine-5'-monophosphatase